MLGSFVKAALTFRRNGQRNFESRAGRCDVVPMRHKLVPRERKRETEREREGERERERGERVHQGVLTRAQATDSQLTQEQVRRS